MRHCRRYSKLLKLITMNNETKFQFNHDYRVWAIIIAILFFQTILLLSANGQDVIRFNPKERYYDQVSFIYVDTLGVSFHGVCHVGDDYSSDWIEWLEDDRGFDSAAVGYVYREFAFTGKNYFRHVDRFLKSKNVQS